MKIRINPPQMGIIAYYVCLLICDRIDITCSHTGDPWEAPSQQLTVARLVVATFSSPAVGYTPHS